MSDDLPFAPLQQAAPTVSGIDSSPLAPSPLIPPPPLYPPAGFSPPGPPLARPSSSSSSTWSTVAVLVGAVVLALGIGVAVAAVVFMVMLLALLPEVEEPGGALAALFLSGFWAVGAGIVSALIAIPVSAVGIGLLRRR